MAQPSITRRAVAGLALTAAPVALAGADNAYAQARQPICLARVACRR
jgi:hypothetical protein